MDLLELHPHGTFGMVTRRIARSPAVVDLVLAHAGADLPPFRPVPVELRSWGWRAQIRLRWPRPALAPEPLVGVELAPWSATETELRLAPLATHGLHWGDRRWDRYFAVAHGVADGLVDLLESTPTPLPASPPTATPSRW